MKFGAHISTASPFSESINRAKAANCDCMQIFVNAPQRWYPTVIPENEEQRFVELNKKNKIGPIISHSIYLISLSGNNPFFYETSQKSLIDELEKGKRLGLFGVNTHLGSSKDKSFSEVKDKVVLAVNNILSAVPAEYIPPLTPPNLGGENRGDWPYFIIENSAGAGNIIGDQIEEIGEIIQSMKSSRVKVLIDTAHAFASGYPIHTKDGLDGFIQKFDELIGLDRLVGLHLNDSMTPLNSKKDRHANIGEGEIGIEAFERIVNHPKLKDLFGIIETPSLKGKGGVDNLAILRSLEKSN